MTAIVGEAWDRGLEASTAIDVVIAVGMDEVSLTGDPFDGEPVAVVEGRELAGGCAADIFNEVSCAKSPVMRQPPIYVVYAQCATVGEFTHLSKRVKGCFRSRGSLAGLYFAPCVRY